MSDDALDRIAHRLIRERLQPELVRTPSLSALVAERCSKHRMDSPVQYAELVERSDEEVGWLRAQIAVPETWLFRYPDSFEYLRRWVVEHRHRWSEQRPLRILSIACASGAEPLSAMIASASALVECGLDPSMAVRTVQADALDPNAAAIEAATSGQLPRMALRAELPAWAQRWVTMHNGMPRIDPQVRERCTFECGSAPMCLLQRPAAIYDVVYCRNLAIYLNEAGRREIGVQITRLLAAHGIVLLGHADRPALLGLDAELVSLQAAPASAFMFRRRHDTHAEPRPPAPSSRGGDIAAAPNGGGSQATFLGAQRAADEGRLDEARTAATALHAGGAREPALLHLLGTLALAAGDDPAAEQWLRQVVYAEPNHDEALLTMAVLAERRGDMEGGRRFRQRASLGAGGES
ncbi:MAG: hypothetical protein O2819_04500 [Planctomycetota bacterium]|nr:hypothetical protein [Planctomycetota bacterium]MDA1106516.1 hypothetical protein [Planctomycetota bacterium]